MGNDLIPGAGRAAPSTSPFKDALTAAADSFLGIPPPTVVLAAGAMNGADGARNAQALQAGRQLLAASGANTKPRLFDFDPQMAKIDEASGQALIDLLSNKANEQSIKTLSTEIRSDKDRMKRTTDERVKAIQEATQKAMEAANKEGGFFSKLFSFVGKILSPISSVATMVVGAALMATGVGAVAGGFLIAHGAMGVASTAMDIVDSIRTAQGKEPIGWRPSFGFFAAKALEVVGVPESVSKWVGMGVEVVAAGAAIVTSGGAALAKVGLTAGKAVDAAKTAVSSSRLAQQWLAMDTTTKAAKISQVSTVVSGGANIGKQVINIQVESLKKDAALADARAVELKAQVDRLLKMVQQNTDFVKDLAQRMQEINESISDSVSSRTEVGITMAQNIKING